MREDVKGFTKPESQTTPPTGTKKAAPLFPVSHPFYARHINKKENVPELTPEKRALVCP